MRNYYPQSWSQQARNMSNSEIQSINAGWSTIRGTLRFFSNSYRHPLIRQRAAKHFGRKRREGKVRENMAEYYKHYPEERSN